MIPCGLGSMALLMMGSLAPSSADAISKEQMIGMLLDMQEQIRDFEFQFEGKMTVFRFPSDDRTLPVEDRLSTIYEGRPENMGLVYQGTAAYRQDKSLHLDTFFKPDLVTPRKQEHREIKVLFDRAESRGLYFPNEPDNPWRGFDPKGSGLLAFTGTGYPSTMVGYPWFLAYLRDVQGEEYEFVGWEEVDGSRCAVVRLFSVNRRTGKPFLSSLYWLDIERGMHVVKHEAYSENNELKARECEVRLVQIPTEDGKLVWFPVAAKMEGYGDGVFRYSKRQSSELTYHILDGTLRINQGLGDNRFTVGYGLDGAVIAAMRESKVRRPPREQISTAEQLKTALAEAEKTSKPRVAVSTAQAPWLNRHGAALGVAGVAMAVLAIAAVLKWRAG